MQNVEELKNRALSLLKSTGFRISEDVSVAVDQSLPFMGYTTERNGKPLIVVSKWSLKSNMLIGLLIHEMSHIYRTETKHPSHNFLLHSQVIKKALNGKRLLPYQDGAIHNIINSIQDLYADDIFFKVFKGKYPTNISEFFLGWVHKPRTDSSVASVWENSGYLVSAAFAKANLERHNVADTNGKVAKAVKDFLSHIDKRMAKKFPYFKRLMVDLPENVTDESFSKLLLEYLREFLALTKVSKD